MISNKKRILGFVGDLAAGKGTACQYLKERYGINSYRFSTMLRDVLTRLHLPTSRENLQKISKLLRENFSQDLLSQVIKEDVINDHEEIVAVEGIRRPTDITYLKELNNFHLIYITADPKLRWQRLVERKENPGDDQKTYEEFLKDEQAEADVLIKEFGRQAEHTITNNGTKEEFFKQIDILIKKLK